MKIPTLVSEAAGLIADLFWLVVGTLLCMGAEVAYFLCYREALYTNTPMVGAVNEHPGLPPQSGLDVKAEERIRADD